MHLCYTAFYVQNEPSLDADDEAPEWRRVQSAAVDNFHSASSDHRPRTRAKLLYDENNLYLRFGVSDRYVVSRRTEFQGSVCCDSCVEFFVQPGSAAGYMSFEINCGGTLLSYFIEDPTRTADGFARYTPIAPEHGRLVRIEHSMPKVIESEITDSVDWHVGCRIPRDVLEAYFGPLGPIAGQQWKANFFKCADESSHPHWASWSPIGDELNFHQPSRFGALLFAAPDETIKQPCHDAACITAEPL